MALHTLKYIYSTLMLVMQAGQNGVCLFILTASIRVSVDWLKANAQHLNQQHLVGW